MTHPHRAPKLPSHQRRATRPRCTILRSAAALRRAAAARRLGPSAPDSCMCWLELTPLRGGHALNWEARRCANDGSGTVTVRDDDSRSMAASRGTHNGVWTPPRVTFDLIPPASAAQAGQDVTTRKRRAASCARRKDHLRALDRALLNGVRRHGPRFSGASRLGGNTFSTLVFQLTLVIFHASAGRYATKSR